MASRRKARIVAFQALYAWDASAMPLDDVLSLSWLDADSSMNNSEEFKAFARIIISGCIDNIKVIDETIERYLRNWSLERTKKVELAILRISIYSLLYQDEIDPKITIDEAVEIAKEFASDESYRFINGVLDAVWKEKAQLKNIT